MVHPLLLLSVPGMQRLRWHGPELALVGLPE
jgi:hypothetical protein